MRIFICCSKHHYNKIPEIKRTLEMNGHMITLPNSYDAPFKEEEMKKIGKEEHVSWKANMIKKQDEKVKANDAVLVLNFDKNGQKNYIGGATFLEMFKAWETGKKIFLYNDIPDGMLNDEIAAFSPIIINGDLNKIN
ncbi:MAG: hypothetical protein Q8Q31_02315 [Nanoarchaeota archaeon]|nr:hypothetical protein [Nanoarchaeota archaeon]